MTLEARLFIALIASAALAMSYIGLAARFVDLSYLQPLELRRRRGRAIFGFILAGVAFALLDPVKPGWTIIMVGQAPLDAGGLLGARGEVVGMAIASGFVIVGILIHLA